MKRRWPSSLAVACLLALLAGCTGSAGPDGAIQASAPGGTGVVDPAFPSAYPSPPPSPPSYSAAAPGVDVPTVSATGSIAATGSSSAGSSSAGSSSAGSSSAGSSSAGSSSGGSGTAAQPGGASLRWKRTDLRPLSGTTGVDGVIVLYTLGARSAEITGIDPATGSTLWSRPTLLTDPDSAAVQVYRHLVVHFKPVGTGRMSRLTLLDPRSGAETLISDARRWSDEQIDCGGPLCANASVSDRDIAFGVDTRTAQSRRLGSTWGATGGYLSTDGLIISGDRASSTLSVHQPRTPSRPGWTVDLAKLPVPKGMSASVDTGRFDRTVVVSAHFRPSDEHRPDFTTTRFDPAHPPVTVALDVQTGKQRWRVTGSTALCGGLERSEQVVLSCRPTGPLAMTTATATTPARLRGPAGPVVLAALDPTTGKPLWDKSLTVDPTIATGWPRAFDAYGNPLLPGADRSALDLVTGRLRPVPPTEVVWCRDQTPISPGARLMDGAGPIETVIPGGRYLGCRPDGSPTSATPTAVPQEVAAAATVAGATVAVVAGPTSLTGWTDPTAASYASQPIASRASRQAGPPAERPVRWSSSGLIPVSQPSIVAGTAVLFATIDNGLHLVVLDPATGRLRRAAPAAWGARNPDSALTIQTWHDQVWYWAPTHSDSTVQLMLFDPKTGERKPVGAPARWYGFPHDCGGDMLCAGQVTDVGDLEVRIDPAAGTTGAAVSPAPEPAAITSLAVTLETTDGAARRSLTRTVGGKTIWSLPWSKLTRGIAQPELGPHAWTTASPGLVVVSFRSGQTDAAGKPPSRIDPRTTMRTVGVNLSTGRVTWERNGLSLICDGLLSPRWFTNRPGLACEYTGSYLRSSEEKAAETFDAAGVRTTLHGIDLTTGTDRWSVDLGYDSPLARPGYPDGWLWTLDDHSIVVHRSAQPDRVIDLYTGKTRAATAKDIFWCTTEISYRVDDPDRIVRGENAYRGCSTGATGRRIPSRLPGGFGATHGDLQLISLGDRVIAMDNR